MKRLRKALKVTNIIEAIAFTIAVVCFMLMYGSVGNFDFAAEVGQIMSKSEELKSYIVGIVGVIGMSLFAGIGMFCHSLSKRIEEEISYHREMARLTRERANAVKRFQKVG